MLMTGLALVIILFFVWLTYGRNAPYFPLHPTIVSEALKMAKLKKGDQFYDLGSGDGRVVIAAARQGAHAHGVEIALVRVWRSRFKINRLKIHPKPEIIHQNIFKTDLSRADVIYIYLLRATNMKLKPKFEKELKKGTQVISIAFEIPGWQPVAVNPHGPKFGPIYLYQR
jgi:predicted RNA methylase